MIQILGKVRIESLPQFVSVFATRGAVMRRQHGSRRGRLYKVADCEDQVVVLFDWDSREAFERFLADPVVKQTMKSSGALAPPEFTFLDIVAEFPS